VGLVALVIGIWVFRFARELDATAAAFELDSDRRRHCSTTAMVN
jgi:hypothetical protein